MATETLGPIDTEQVTRLASDLRFAGVVPPSEKIISANRFFDSGRRAETWMYGYEVVSSDFEGNQAKRRILERNLISEAGDLTYKALTFYKTSLEASKLGIPIPKTYGVKGGSIYHDFIDDECAEKVLKELKTNPDPQLFAQLQNIASILDANGYAVESFTRDLVFDPSKGVFLYSDFGWDFPKPKDHPVNTNSSHLEKIFS